MAVSLPFSASNQSSIFLSLCCQGVVVGEVGEVITARGETSCPSGPYRVTMGPRWCSNLRMELS